MLHLPSARLHRRGFLRHSGAVAAGTGLAAGSLCPRARARAAEEAAAAAAGPVDVGVARGSSMEDAVKLAVELSGGLDFIQPNQTILIKPNCTGGAKNPTTTSPEVLYAVIKLVAERGPKRILVSDRSFSPLFIQDPEKALKSPTTLHVMKQVGHLDAVNQAIADVKAPVVAVGLEDAAQEFELLGLPADTPHWRKIQHEKATHWPNGFELAELLLAVDHVINLPVIKTHFQAWFTMSMKAFVGMSHHRTRREFHSSFNGANNLFDQRSSGRRRRRGKDDHDQAVAEVQPLVNRISELNLGLKPTLNILDGTQSFVFGGPSDGDTAEPKLIVASRDRIAADATGVAVLKHLGTEDRLQNYSVWENPFIRHAIEIGLGIDGVDKLNLKHAGIPEEEITSIREMLG